MLLLLLICLFLVKIRPQCITGEKRHKGHGIMLICMVAFLLIVWDFLLRHPLELFDEGYRISHDHLHVFMIALITTQSVQDRKSTHLNSSHTVISYAVFCLKKKNK